jgi:SAM-dependent methyltransferase
MLWTLMETLPPGFRYSRRDIFSLAREFQLTGSLCHVGSLLNDKEEGQAELFRNKLANVGLSPFVGIDLFPGQNVDVVADLCDARFFEIHGELEHAFDVVFCSALLEHVPDLFACARTIRRLIKPGGHLYFAGPWVQGYHSYPDDFWRISHSGMRVLFPDLEWLVKWYQGNLKGKERFTVDFDDPRAERKLFAVMTDQMPVPISTRAMANLIVGALGRAPV